MCSKAIQSYRVPEYVQYVLLNTVAAGCAQRMTFRQCGRICPQSCDVYDATCQGGCAEGCFCPEGNFLNADGECEPLAAACRG